MRPLVLLLTLLVGVGLGWIISPRGNNSEAERSGIRNEPVETPRRGGRTGTSPSTGYREASIPGLLNSAFAEGSANYPAVRDLMAALAFLTRSNTGVFTEFFKNQPLDENQIVLWRFFFSAWGEVDPDAALAFIDERFDQGGARRLFYAAVLDCWGGEAPEKALEFAMDNFVVPEAREQAGLAFDYLRELAKEDPEQALKLAAQLRSEELLFDLTARRISQLGKESSQSALDALAKLEGELHSHAVSQYVIDWAKDEPSAAAEWLADVYDASMGTYPLLEVAREFVQSDPNAALQWIGALPADQPRGTILGEAVLAWVQKDPVGASAWLRTLETNPEYDAAVVAVGSQLAGTDPQAAIEEWVPRISDPAQRNEFLYEVTGAWQRENLAGFSDWIERTTSLSEQAKQRLLAREAPVSVPPAGNAPAVGPAPELDQGR